MKNVNERLYNHPELGISPELVNGRQIYRQRSHPNAIGVWISKDRVKEITDRIPARLLPQYEAEDIVKIIQDFGLGEHALRTAQKKHYDLLMEDEHQFVPQAAARQARELAIKYNLGDDARQAAELKVYNALMGNEHQLRVLNNLCF